MRLEPGAYTTVVTGANDTTGIALSRSTRWNTIRPTYVWRMPSRPSGAGAFFWSKNRPMRHLSKHLRSHIGLRPGRQFEPAFHPLNISSEDNCSAAALP